MSNQLSLIEQDGGEVIESPPRQAAQPNDLRHAMMSLPVEQQTAMLSEYKARRQNFREWLKAQLIEGTHFGFVPGCEPKQEMRKVNGLEVWGYVNRGNWAPAHQWTPKPSLYVAGADFICDLLGVRAEFKADLDAWQQLGSPSGTFVMCCKLFSRATGELLGEGHGVRKNGQKGGDENNAIKMAEKSAKVDAVINAYGLRDLYSQDEETPPQPPHENPDANPKAPKADPRGKRKAVTAQEVKDIASMWLAKNPSPDGNMGTARQLFNAWVWRTCDREFNNATAAEWTQDDVKRCRKELDMPEPENAK